MTATAQNQPPMVSFFFSHETFSSSEPWMLGWKKRAQDLDDFLRCFFIRKLWYFSFNPNGVRVKKITWDFDPKDIMIIARKWIERPISWESFCVWRSHKKEIRKIYQKIKFYWRPFLQEILRKIRARKFSETIQKDNRILLWREKFLAKLRLFNKIQQLKKYERQNMRRNKTREIWFYFRKFTKT